MYLQSRMYVVVLMFAGYSVIHPCLYMAAAVGVGGFTGVMHSYGIHASVGDRRTIGSRGDDGGQSEHTLVSNIVRCIDLWQEAGVVATHYDYLTLDDTATGVDGS